MTSKLKGLYRSSTVSPTEVTSLREGTGAKKGTANKSLPWHPCLMQTIQKQTLYGINVLKKNRAALLCGARITSNHSMSEHLVISLTKLKGQMLAFVEKLASPLLSLPLVPRMVSATELSEYLIFLVFNVDSNNHILHE